LAAVETDYEELIADVLPLAVEADVLNLPSLAVSAVKKYQTTSITMQ